MKINNIAITKLNAVKINKLIPKILKEIIGLIKDTNILAYI